MCSEQLEFAPNKLKFFNKCFLKTNVFGGVIQVLHVFKNVKNFLGIDFFVQDLFYINNEISAQWKAIISWPLLLILFETKHTFCCHNMPLDTPHAFIWCKGIQQSR